MRLCSTEQTQIAQMGYYLSAYELYMHLSRKYPDVKKYKTNAKITKRLSDNIADLSKNQTSEGAENARQFKGKFKKSKGGSKMIYQTKSKKNTNFDLNSANIERWLGKVQPSLEGF